MSSPTTPHDAVSHLHPEHWRAANRNLLRKALAEFSHERLLTPHPVGDDTYRITSDDRTVEYRFRARRKALDHWWIDTESIARTSEGVAAEPDLLGFVLELRDTLGLGGEVLPMYLEELSSTLSAAAYRLACGQPMAKELVRAPFQEIEASLPDGHPCFVANSGRLGFDAAEYRQYSPEAATPARLVWLAAHRKHCSFTCSDTLDYDELMSGELAPDTRKRFTAHLRRLGLKPDDYWFLPVHPWQWRNTLAVTLAAELATRRLVCLGDGDDEYRPQQSIRTLYNTSQPSRSYVKTALSVLNMGFTRGLSAEYMRATPAINDWVAELIAGDELLRQSGFSILREHAAIGYHPGHYEQATQRGSAYRKLLAALWRESPVPQLGDDQRLVSMAALLHVDESGDSFAAALIERSGLDAETWLRHYLDAYLVPLLHCFYAHDVVFMPHGENIILVLQGDVVTRVHYKDVAEETAVLNNTTPLPPEVARIRSELPESIKALSIFTDIIDSFLRFFSAVLDETGTVAEQSFWATVAACITDYQRRVPQLAERFAAYDLFAETFELSCLNRLQLRDNRQMVNLTDPSEALQLVGTLDNPIAPFRERSS